MTMVPAIVASALLILRGERQRYCQRSEEESGSMFWLSCSTPWRLSGAHAQIASASAGSNSICAFKSVAHRSVGHRSPIVWKCFDTERVRWEQGQNARSTSTGKSVCLLRDVNDAVNSFLAILLFFAHRQPGRLNIALTKELVVNHGPRDRPGDHQVTQNMGLIQNRSTVTAVAPYNKPACPDI
jgi:hypothetical protein